MRKTRLTKVLALTMVLLMVMSTTVFGAITSGTRLSNDLTATFSVANDPNANIANVTSLTELQLALNRPVIDTINIKNDIVGIGSRLVINRALTINGESHKLAFTEAINNVEYGTRHGILVMANNVNINNLTVEMTEHLAFEGFDGWDGVYGIQVISATGVVLNNVTATKADGGILVNGAVVQLTGATTLSGNEFGGIEVSKGEMVVSDPYLTVSGTLVNLTEGIALPTIWEVGVIGKVESNNNLIKIGIKGQQQYYLNTDNTEVITLTGLSGIIAATVGQVKEVTVAATIKDNVVSVQNAKLVIEVTKKSDEPVLTEGDLNIAGMTGTLLNGKLTLISDNVLNIGDNNLFITFINAGTYYFDVYVTQ